MAAAGTFTYGFDLTQNIDFVRFETGDTTEGEHYLADELITSLVSTSGSSEAAVVKALAYIIMQLSKPDFKADWLSISNAEARKGYQQMLAEKKKEYGLGGITAGVVYTYRVDSDMEDPN